MKNISNRPLRYLLSGGTAAVVEFASFNVLTFLTGNLLVDNAISFLLGLLVSFWLNKKWVFKVDGDGRRQLVRYISLAFCNLMLSSLLIWVAVDIFNVLQPVAKFAVMIIIAFSNYFLFSKIIFKNS